MAKVITTPAGIAVYPWIKEGHPDTRFDANGLYKIDVTLSAAEGEALQAEAEAVRDAYADELRAQLPAAKAKKLKIADVPIEEQEDGTYLIKTKMKAKIESKKGTFTQSPKVFDASGKPMFNEVVDSEGNVAREAVDVRGGSVVRVAFEAVPYESSLMGVGVTFRLKAVQVIKLVSSNEASAEQFGFGEEEGYTHTVTQSAKAHSTAGADQLDDDDDDFNEDDF